MQLHLQLQQKQFIAAPKLYGARPFKHAAAALRPPPEVNRVSFGLWAKPVSRLLLCRVKNNSGPLQLLFLTLVLVWEFSQTHVSFTVSSEYLLADLNVDYICFRNSRSLNSPLFLLEQKGFFFFVIFSLFSRFIQFFVRISL